MDWGCRKLLEAPPGTWGPTPSYGLRPTHLSGKCLEPLPPKFPPGKMRTNSRRSDPPKNKKQKNTGAEQHPGLCPRSRARRPRGSEAPAGSCQEPPLPQGPCRGRRQNEHKLVARLMSSLQGRTPHGPGEDGQRGSAPGGPGGSQMLQRLPWAPRTRAVGGLELPSEAGGTPFPGQGRRPWGGGSGSGRVRFPGQGRVTEVAICTLGQASILWVVIHVSIDHISYLKGYLGALISMV